MKFVEREQQEMRIVWEEQERDQEQEHQELQQTESASGQQEQEQEQQRRSLQSLRSSSSSSGRGVAGRVPASTARLLFGLLFAQHAMVGLVQAQQTFICASFNTGATFSPVYAQFQSQGLCAGTCSGFAYAVLQGFQCWCTNFTPSSATDTSQCDTGCPGFGTDNCGGQLTGAFAYYQLAQASGTRGPGGASTSSVSPTSSSAPTPESSTRLTTSTDSTSSTTPASSRTSTVEGQTESTTSAVDPVTVFVTQTPGATGAPRTVTQRISSSARPSASVAADNVSNGNNNGDSSGEGFFDNAGKVAGVFVAVGLVLLAAIAALVWFLRKRHRQRDSSDSRASGGTAGALVDRKGSQSSSNTGNHLMSQGGRSRSGSLMAIGAGAGAEKSNRSGRTTPRGGWPDEIIPVDQRLNPKPLLMRFDSNYSRHSLRDEEDYSRRVLTVTNPSDD